MRISNSFFRTEKNTPGDALAESYRLLHRGGYIRQSAPGLFAWLPLGQKGLDRIVRLFEEELGRAGAERADLSRMGAPEFFGSLRPSYKDLPIRVFQFCPGAREEANPREGLIGALKFLKTETVLLEKDEPSLEKAFGDFGRVYERIFRMAGMEPLIMPETSNPPGHASGLRFMLLTPETAEKPDIYWDEKETVEPLEKIDASLDSRIYRKILKFYAQHPEKTLKNMLYRADERENICVVIRGDRKIDMKKLRALLGCNLIRPLTSEEIAALGSYPGFISAIGLGVSVRVLVDGTVKYNKNYWDGGNQDMAFRKNVNFERDFTARESVDVREERVYAPGGESIMICDHCRYAASPVDAEFVREPVGMEEEMKSFMMIEQPEWVCTMDDNIVHYRKPLPHFLKNVVYRDPAGRLIIGVLRGDLEANPAKIAKILGCGDLEMADGPDFERLATLPGWVHSWGHDRGRSDIVFIADEALKVSRNLIGGWKEKDRDAFNVNYGREFTHAHEGDIAMAPDGAKCKWCAEGRLKKRGALELGRSLMTGPSPQGSNGALFVDRDGKDKPMLAAAFEADLGRLMAGAAEINRDEKGIIWPKRIAPYFISLITIGRTPEVMEQSEKVYGWIRSEGWDVLWDDREDVSPGAKLVDADLIGSPIRIVVSDRGLKQNTVEIKLRSEAKAENMILEETALLNAIKKLDAAIDQRESSLRDKTSSRAS